MKKKIICQLQGGLGNQLFQYAITKSLSIRTSREMLFNFSKINNSLLKANKNDVFFIKNEKINPFSNTINLLDLVNLNLKKSGLMLKFVYNLNRLIRKVERLSGFNIYSNLFTTDFFQEKTVTESSQYQEKFVENCIDSKKKNIFLLGYFQTSKYFSEFSKIIFNDLKPPISKKNNFIEMHNIIKNSNVVAICFRTYFEVPGRNKSKIIDENHMGGIAGIDYYNKSIKIMRQKINNPTFFVFTPKQYGFLKDLDLGHKYYFINNDTGFNGTIDNLWLMSECRYQIISFSSYYWWSAWFAEHKFKNKSYILRPTGLAGGVERKHYYEDTWEEVKY